MMDWSFGALILVTCLHCVNAHDPCFDATSAGNIWYSYHHTDCNQYLQCHARQNSPESVIIYKQCPFGYYWDQDFLRCSNRSSVNCPLARCSFDTRIQGSGCRAYWDCRNGVAVEECCPAGQRYTENNGCINDWLCTDPCPGPCAVNDVCRSLPDWQRDNYYYHNDENGQTYERICTVGTHFDILECGCVSNRRSECIPTYFLDFESTVQSQQALFEARTSWLNSNIQIGNGQAFFRAGTTFTANLGFRRLPEASRTNPYLIRFRYREEFPNNGIRNLLLSNDCKECYRLKVDLVADSFQVTLSKFNSIVAQMVLSPHDFAFDAWKEVIIMYNGRELLAMLRSGSKTYMKRIEAPRVKIMDCTLTFGSTIFEQFSGSLDALAIYSCSPGGRVLDLLPTL